MTADRPKDDLAAEERRLRARLGANLAAADKALKQATRTPTVKGSTGQIKAHPGFATAAKCDELAIRISAELRELRALAEAGEAKRRTRELFAPFAEVDAVGELTDVGGGK